MYVAAFNPLEYAKRLKAADVPEKQAEVEAEALRAILEERDKAQTEQAQVVTALQAQLQVLEASRRQDADKMATKGDIDLVRKETAGEFALVRKDMSAEFALVRKDMLALGEGLRKDLSAQENRIVVRLGGLVVVVAGLIFAAWRLLPPPH